VGEGAEVGVEEVRGATGGRKGVEAGVVVYNVRAWKARCKGRMNLKGLNRFIK
tara:strand:- start:54 stop:212 length:159 start_codon:yes stop_codon:yes gene_type:complete